MDFRYERLYAVAQVAQVGEYCVDKQGRQCSALGSYVLSTKGLQFCYVLLLLLTEVGSTQFHIIKYMS